MNIGQFGRTHEYVNILLILILIIISPWTSTARHDSTKVRHNGRSYGPHPVIKGYQPTLWETYLRYVFRSAITNGEASGSIIIVWLKFSFPSDIILTCNSQYLLTKQKQFSVRYICTVTSNYTYQLSVNQITLTGVVYKSLAVTFCACNINRINLQCRLNYGQRRATPPKDPCQNYDTYIYYKSIFRTCPTPKKIGDKISIGFQTKYHPPILSARSIFPYTICNSFFKRSFMAAFSKALMIRRKIVSKDLI